MIYRACLCYSDAQAGAAEALRAALDGKPTPKPLVGAAGAHGPAPDVIEIAPLGQVTLFPGGQLADDVEAALTEANGLVVLCSLDTSSDIAINRVIDRFMTLDRSRPVFAVIAAEAPDVHEIERDFFPPALLGRSLLAADLRDLRRPDGALVGDGEQAGLTRLHAALIGVSVQRLAEENARALRARTRGFAALAVALGVICAAGVGYGAFAAYAASRAEHARQDAQHRAEEAAQRGQEAAAARDAEAAARAHAAAAAEAERATLRDGVQSLTAEAGAAVDAVAASQAASPTNLRALRAVEDAARKIGANGWVFGVRPETAVGLWEKLGGAYGAIGRGEDARALQTRFSQFNQRLAQNGAADPAWRAGYAASLAGLYAARLAKQDRAGALTALQEAAGIDAALCGMTDAGNTHARATACLALANLELRRARAMRGEQQPVDSAALTRAQSLLEAALAALPHETALQAQGPAARDQIARLLDQ